MCYDLLVLEGLTVAIVEGWLLIVSSYQKREILEQSSD